MVEKRPKVALLTTVTAPMHKEAYRILHEVAEVKNVETKGWIVDEAVLDGVTNVDAILVRVGRVTSEVIDAAKKLQVIAVHGAGVDRVDVQAATERGIVVTNSGDANSTTVAEYTFSLILSISRKLPRIFHLMEKEGWRSIRQTLPSITGFELDKKTIGIVGFGNIGRKITKRRVARHRRRAHLRGNGGPRPRPGHSPHRSDRAFPPAPGGGWRRRSRPGPQPHQRIGPGVAP